MDFTWWLYILLYIVAFLYASVGHGGASGYLALMAIAGTAPSEMKPTALILNLFVSLVAFIQFYKGGHFRLKLVWPFLLASVPFAFLGGRMKIGDEVYKQLLGILLLIPAIRFLFMTTKTTEELKDQNIPLSLVIGGVIGFLSGLIGIGGGVLLSPVLIILHWADQKQTAAACSIFIFINSVSGLAGQMSKGIDISTSMMTMTIIAFCGGLTGAYFGARRFDQKVLRYILATVLIVASVKLLFKV
ncbi:MAG: sulfite exporter TauE/SafE family protein [Saprospiraceae bacterium]